MGFTITLIKGGSLAMIFAGAFTNRSIISRIFPLLINIKGDNISKRLADIVLDFLKT